MISLRIDLPSRWVLLFLSVKILPEFLRGRVCAPSRYYRREIQKLNRFLATAGKVFQRERPAELPNPDPDEIAVVAQGQDLLGFQSFQTFEEVVRIDSVALEFILLDLR